MRPFSLTVGMLALVALPSCASCAADFLGGVGKKCHTDGDCGNNTFCALGTCQQATARDLGNVDLEVDPLVETGFKRQTFLGVDTITSSRHPLVLRPTLQITLRVCYNCTQAAAGMVPGTLFLNPPVAIAGQPMAETSPLDSNGISHVGLLANLAYDPLLWPAESAQPLLRGERLFAAAVNQLDVSLPDPTAAFTVTGRLVEDVHAVPMVPVAQARVWITQSEVRLSQDQLTAGDGTFTVRVLSTTSSGLTLWVAAGVSDQPIPGMSVPGINLDQDKDLGDVGLGLIMPRVALGGRITGPDGTPLAGARVKLDGPAGAGVLHFSTVTQDDGTYAGVVPVGTYDRAIIPAPQSNAAILQEAEVPVGVLADGGSQQAQQQDVRLLTPTQLCGTVETRPGVTLGNTAVTATRMGNAEGTLGPAANATLDVRATVDGNGHYCLNVSPGRYVLTAVPPEDTGVPSRSMVVNVGSSNKTVDLAIPRGAFIVGVVTTPQGAPLALTRVKAFSPVTTFPRGALLLGETVSGDDGTFALVLPDLVGGTTEAP